MKRSKVAVEIPLEWVNTQIGFLRACIAKRKENTSDLAESLVSLKGLKQGLETDNWPDVVIESSDDDAFNSGLCPIPESPYETRHHLG